MRDSSFFKKYYDSIDLSSIYETIYEYIYIVCDFSFNYCPIHYQMLYFYFPILYIYVRSKKKEQLYSEIHNSTLNYLFLTSSNLTKKLLNSNFIVYLTTNLFKKILLFVKIFLLKTIGFPINTLIKLFRSNHLWLNWKPIFKKFSYFGLFSFIRSKWYKNK